MTYRAGNRSTAIDAVFTPFLSLQETMLDAPSVCAPLARCAIPAAVGQSNAAIAPECQARVSALIPFTEVWREMRAEVSVDQWNRVGTASASEDGFPDAGAGSDG